MNGRRRGPWSGTTAARVTLPLYTSSSQNSVGALSLDARCSSTAGARGGSVPRSSSADHGTRSVRRRCRPIGAVPQQQVTRPQKELAHRDLRSRLSTSLQQAASWSASKRQPDAPLDDRLQHRVKIQDGMCGEGIELGAERGDLCLQGGEVLWCCRRMSRHRDGRLGHVERTHGGDPSVQDPASGRLRWSKLRRPPRSPSRPERRMCEPWPPRVPSAQSRRHLGCRRPS